MGDMNGQKKSRSARRGGTWKRTRKDSYKETGFLFETLGAMDQGCPSLGAFPSERWPLHGQPQLCQGNYPRAMGAVAALCPSCKMGSQSDIDGCLYVRSVKRDAVVR